MEFNVSTATLHRELAFVQSLAERKHTKGSTPVLRNLKLRASAPGRLEITGSDSTFGLPASVSGAMIPHVAVGLGLYGAARSMYSNFLGRGRDIELPQNTPMEIHLEKHR